MAKYWIYINDQVLGPYSIEQLIRVPGFSRQTMVSVDGHSGATGKWISPAEIPELAKIFQKVEEIHDAPIPTPRPAAKPKPYAPARLTPVPPPAEEPRRPGLTMVWLAVVALAVAAAGYYFFQTQQSRRQAEERQDAQQLIETFQLPSRSSHPSIRAYLDAKELESRWEFERTPAGLYHVTLSWWPSGDVPKSLPIYSFETNLQAKSVRGLNSAAMKLLAEGFAAPVAAAAPKPPAPPKKSPGDQFPGAINGRRQAIEQGDFDAVWDSFSRHRKSEMNGAGITEAGFVRMQKLTYRAGPPPQQTIVKTRNDSDTQRLVLIRQTQARHPDIYIKQSWVWEDEHWRLDNEEKKVASAPGANDPETPAPAVPEKPTPRPIPNLPGLSDTTSR
jgi:hypothetical protein